MNLSDSPGRPACPSRASGWSSLTTPWGLPCCVRFPCVHAVATTPAQRLRLFFSHFSSIVSAFPDMAVGSAAHRPFRGLLGVHSRYGLHTRAVTVFRDTLSEGFSYFVTSIAGRVAAGIPMTWCGSPPSQNRTWRVIPSGSQPESSTAGWDRGCGRSGGVAAEEPPPGGSGPMPRCGVDCVDLAICIEAVLLDTHTA